MSELCALRRRINIAQDFACCAEGIAQCGARNNAVFLDFQPHGVIAELRDRFEYIAQRRAETIEIQYDNNIARARKIEHLFEPLFELKRGFIKKLRSQPAEASALELSELSCFRPKPMNTNESPCLSALRFGLLGIVFELSDALCVKVPCLTVTKLTHAQAVLGLRSRELIGGCHFKNSTILNIQYILIVYGLTLIIRNKLLLKEID